MIGTSILQVLGYIAIGILVLMMSGLLLTAHILLILNKVAPRYRNTMGNGTFWTGTIFMIILDLIILGALLKEVGI